jgi:beta-1,2-mannobiose phosphorylase / 1,2-beta-oligomannan phosphorylase
MSADNTSVIGYAESKTGTDIKYRSDKPIYVPKESFEEKRVPNGNSGCEDPRLTKIGSTIYMCYVAYNGATPPSVAMTHISEKDFLARNWSWSRPVLVSRDGVDDKDGCLHPEKVDGKYFLFHRVDNSICADFGLTASFLERNNFKNIPILSPRHGMWDSQKVGICAPPIKTKKGWILLYHGVSDDTVYRVGAVLLSLKDPTKVLSRTTDYLFEPKEPYETSGQINCVVFPCGAVVRGGIIYMYYGAGDSVIDVASIPLKKLLDVLVK